MTEQDRIDRFLAGLAELTKDTGIGLAFGCPGSESQLVITDGSGRERFQVIRLEPSDAEGDQIEYQLEFSGTLRISSRSAEKAAPAEKPELADEPIPIGSIARTSGSLVRVERLFADRQVPDRRDRFKNPRLASGE